MSATTTAAERVTYGNFLLNVCRHGEHFGEKIIGKIEELIAHGADINYRDDGGNTPLHWACHSLKKLDQTAKTDHLPCGLRVVIRLLKAGANVDAVNSTGWLPLHFAARSGNNVATEILLHGISHTVERRRFETEPLRNFLVKTVSSKRCSGAELCTLFLVDHIRKRLYATIRDGNESRNVAVPFDHPYIGEAYTLLKENTSKVLKANPNCIPMGMGHYAMKWEHLVETVFLGHRIKNCLCMPIYSVAQMKADIEGIDKHEEKKLLGLFYFANKEPRTDAAGNVLDFDLSKVFFNNDDAKKVYEVVNREGGFNIVVELMEKLDASIEYIVEDLFENTVKGFAKTKFQFVLDDEQTMKYPREEPGFVSDGANDKARYSQHSLNMGCNGTYNETQVVDALRTIKNSGIDCRTLNMSTPLMLAVQSGKCRTVGLLLDAGADPFYRNSCNDSPLHVAASDGNNVLVHMLCEALCDPFCLNDAMQTPRHICDIHLRADIKKLELLTENAITKVTKGSIQGLFLLRKRIFSDTAAHGFAGPIIARVKDFLRGNIFLKTHMLLISVEQIWLHTLNEGHVNTWQDNEFEETYGTRLYIPHITRHCLLRGKERKQPQHLMIPLPPYPPINVCHQIMGGSSDDPSEKVRLTRVIISFEIPLRSWEATTQYIIGASTLTAKTSTQESPQFTFPKVIPRTNTLDRTDTIKTAVEYHGAWSKEKGQFQNWNDQTWRESLLKFCKVRLGTRFANAEIKPLPPSPSQSDTCAYIERWLRNYTKYFEKYSVSEFKRGYQKVRDTVYEDGLLHNAFYPSKVVLETVSFLFSHPQSTDLEAMAFTVSAENVYGQTVESVPSDGNDEKPLALKDYSYPPQTFYAQSKKEVKLRIDALRVLRFKERKGAPLLKEEQRQAKRQESLTGKHLLHDPDSHRPHGKELDALQIAHDYYDEWKKYKKFKNWEADKGLIRKFIKKLRDVFSVPEGFPALAPKPSASKIYSFLKKWLKEFTYALEKENPLHPKHGLLLYREGVLEGPRPNGRNLLEWTFSGSDTCRFKIPLSADGKELNGGNGSTEHVIAKRNDIPLSHSLCKSRVEIPRGWSFITFLFVPCTRVDHQCSISGIHLETENLLTFKSSFKKSIVKTLGLLSDEAEISAVDMEDTLTTVRYSVLAPNDRKNSIENSMKAIDSARFTKVLMTILIERNVPVDAESEEEAAGVSVTWGEVKFPSSDNEIRHKLCKGTGGAMVTVAPLFSFSGEPYDPSIKLQIPIDCEQCILTKTKKGFGNDCLTIIVPPSTFILSGVTYAIELAAGALEFRNPFDLQEGAVKTSEKITRYVLPNRSKVRWNRSGDSPRHLRELTNTQMQWTKIPRMAVSLDSSHECYRSVKPIVKLHYPPIFDLRNDKSTKNWMTPSAIKISNSQNKVECSDCHHVTTPLSFVSQNMKGLPTFHTKSIRQCNVCGHISLTPQENNAAFAYIRSRRQIPSPQLKYLNTPSEASLFFGCSNSTMTLLRKLPELLLSEEEIEDMKKLHAKDLNKIEFRLRSFPDRHSYLSKWAYTKQRPVWPEALLNHIVCIYLGNYNGPYLTSPIIEDELNAYKEGISSTHRNSYVYHDEIDNEMVAARKLAALSLELKERSLLQKEKNKKERNRFKEAESRKEELLNEGSKEKELEQKFLQAQDLLKKSDMDSKATPGNGGFFSCFFSRPVDGKKIKKPLAKPNVPLTDTAVQTQETGKEGDGEPEKEDRGSQLGDESADEDDVIGDISYGLTYTLATESLRDKTVFILGRK